MSKDHQYSPHHYRSHYTNDGLCCCDWLPPWGEHQERGIYKTTDGGKTEKVLYQNPKTGAADLVMDPNNPNKLIAAMWEHKRDPWFFNSGGVEAAFSLAMTVVSIDTKKQRKTVYRLEN